MNWKLDYKGVLFSLLIATLAIILAKFSPPFLNSVMWALLIGVILRNLIQLPDSLESGISFTSAKMLELSIIFLAFGIDYSQITALGIFSFMGIALTILLILLLTVFLSKKFNCPTNTGILVGFGTAICGSSAIAALSPSLKNGEKEDVAISMAVVNLLGTIGMIFIPMILIELNWSATEMGYLVGGSLHSVGNVAGAGFAMGKEAGDIAITVKLARVALLTPGLLLMTYLTNKKDPQENQSKFQLPWYLIGFILISLLVSMIAIPIEITKGASHTGNVILTIAMGAIGLKVNFKKLIQAGKKGLRIGVVLFLIQILILTGILQLL